MNALDIVIFGGAGDLSLRKLMPALYFLFEGQKLPEGSRITAISRGDMTTDAFLKTLQPKLREFLGPKFNPETAKSFMDCIEYLSLDVSSSTAWQHLRDYLNPSEDRDIIYYMAVPPSLFGTICKQLSLHALNPANSRLVVEKPLGEDQESAEAVNALLSAGFSEKQIYRIDHYLGKEAIQNLLALRFSNRLIGAVWNCEHIERVEITVAETVGVEGRAAYLDHAGVLRDMVQNHLMQILCCLAMETP
ncbi:MAG: glucose-6-phosphate dehydrogenase, partial [Kordiimonas sp.]